MISLKKYLDSAHTDSLTDGPELECPDAMLEAYGSALLEMGNCSLSACPGLGDGLKQDLSGLHAKLTVKINRANIETTGKGVRDRLQQWGRSTANHYREKAAEVKELLLTMASTAESVGARDRHPFVSRRVQRAQHRKRLPRSREIIPGQRAALFPRARAALRRRHRRPRDVSRHRRRIRPRNFFPLHLEDRSAQDRHRSATDAALRHAMI